jgi:hypothetical protein
MLHRGGGDRVDTLGNLARHVNSCTVQDTVQYGQPRSQGSEYVTDYTTACTLV